MVYDLERRRLYLRDGLHGPAKMRSCGTGCYGIFGCILDWIRTKRGSLDWWMRWSGILSTHRFVWDGRDEVARDVAAGVYLYRVEVDGRVEAKKMTKLP